MTLLIISLFFGFISALAAQDAPQVTISQGALFGKELTSSEGNKYHSYQGIPYAKPPLGELRFKPPQNPEPWTGLRNATKEGNECVAPNLMNTSMPVIGNEDCLFLNVYVPQHSVSSDKPLPVMFWIHGGGFVAGSGNAVMYGPDYLMDYDVIVVTINHRLGVLGFLNLDLEEAPGNVGLMDQVAALRWVKDNIASFGGDPDNVTIFGISAGGASVHYLLLSDLASGLFHKAISQSGSALNPWALQKDPLKRAYELCEAMGHPTSDPKDALEFLKGAPAEELADAKLPGMDEQMLNNFIFVPSVEKHFETHEPFLAETPENKMLSGNFNKVPLIIGFTDAEGILGLFGIVIDPELFNKHEADFELFIPKNFDLSPKSEESLRLAKDMRKFYFGDEPVSENNKEKFVALTSDLWFAAGIDKTARLTVEKSDVPVFYYEYGYDEFGIMDVMMKVMTGKTVPTVKGACHGNEMGFLFKNVLMPEIPDEPETAKITQKRLLTMWTNFAKTDNPTPEVSDLLPVKWEPATKEKQNYLSIKSTLSMGVNPMGNRTAFWDHAIANEDLQHL